MILQGAIWIHSKQIREKKKSLGKEVHILNKAVEDMEENYVENIKLKNAVTKR